MVTITADDLYDPLDPSNFEVVTDGASSQGSQSILDPVCNCARNWVKIRYEYEDGTGVPGANYIVQTVAGDATGTVLAEGTTDSNGDAHVPLDAEVGEIEFYFFDDPEGDPYEDPEAEAPLQEPEPGFWARLWDNIAEAGDWVWGVIQGDFNEDASTSQIIARMILTMIPGIDQLADVQDIINILYKLIWKQEWNVLANWILLIITLIGLIPVLGSLAKGVLKMLLRKAGDISALRALYGVFNFFRQSNAHRWLRDFASKLTGEHLQSAIRLLNEMMDRVASYMAGARANFLFRRWNGIIDAGLAKVASFRAIAPAKLGEAADYLKRRLLDTLAAAMTRLQRGATRNSEPHRIRQNVEEPPARVPRDAFDGSPYTQQEYDDYVARKTAAGETPRTPEEYVAARDHWRRGGEAHQSLVDDSIADLETRFPDADISQTPSVTNADGSLTYPDIMVVDEATDSVRFYEVKTGLAGPTANQTAFAADLENATFTAAQADRLGLPDADMTLGDLYPGGVSVEEIRGPGYAD